MTPAAFKQSLKRKTPPAGVSAALFFSMHEDTALHGCQLFQIESGERKSCVRHQRSVSRNGPLAIRRPLHRPQDALEIGSNIPRVRTPIYRQSSPFEEYEPLGDELFSTAGGALRHQHFECRRRVRAWVSRASNFTVQ